MQVLEGNLPITQIPDYNDDYKQFEYIRQPIKESEIAEWREMGSTHDTDSYLAVNPCVGYMMLQII